MTADGSCLDSSTTEPVPTLSMSVATADRTVVVVDDNPTNIVLLERLLRSAGMDRVHGFTEPRQAIAHCAESLPDLVLLDLHMPGLDGFAVLAALAELTPDGRFLPVLVLTADASTEVKQRALAAGAKDFVTKPFDRTEVLLRVANLLETQVLHTRLEHHNNELRADLNARTVAERKAAAEDQRRHHRIDRALMPGNLSMVYQPIADLNSGEVMGAEALARISTHPQRPPNEWFAEADEVGRSSQLELAAITAALADADLLAPTTFLAVNASPAVAASPELAALLADHPSERLVLELTEHTRVDDYDRLLDALTRLRRRGVRIAVDDTGAGYAGLQHILRLRPDILKLDSTLTLDIDVDPVRRSLATALVAFAAETGATIVAEGVETPGQLETLQRIGIPWGQGYHLARPSPLPFAAQRLASVADYNAPDLSNG